MKLKPHIAVVGVPNGDSFRDVALRHANAFERFDKHIVECRLTLGLWNKHDDAGRLFRVRVEVELPHTAVHLARETGGEPSEEDIEEVMRSAVESACGQIDAALAGYDGNNQPVSKLSAEQKRLRPLHGRVE